VTTLTVDLIEQADWETWRRLRLAALTEAPHAFGSTLAETQGRDEASWRTGFPAEDQGANFIARLDGAEAGMCAIIRLPALDDEPLLVSMWVAPGARGSGLAPALVLAAEKWCVEHDLNRMLLDVVEDNLPATALYRRLGYLPTGRTEPLRSDPSKKIVGYARDLA